MSPAVLESIKALLDSSDVPFREVRHPPTRTSEESAAARGEPLAVGGKALLMKVGPEFKLFVLSASRRLDSRRIKEQFGTRDLRFATPEELQEMTGLEPGAVPPFGRPILPFDLYADSSVTENDRIAFNAGSLTTSLVLARDDYLRVAKPQLFMFSR